MTELPLRSLTADVAHELSNQLGCLVLLPDLMLEALPSDSPMVNDLRQIRRAAQRIDELTSHLSLLALDTHQREPMNLNSAVTQVVHGEPLAGLLNDLPGAAVNTHLHEDLLPVQGSPEGLTVVVGNLIRNALDAHPGHPITVSTQPRLVAEEGDAWEPIPPGEYAVLGVSDGGPELPPLERARLFEPYFTHGMGRRSMSGLGMAVVRQMARRMGALLDVRSGPEGTSVEVYFPTASKPPRVVFPTVPDRVLVVDDREEQRQVISRILRGQGYRVSAVGGKEETLSHLESTGADLVIIDISLRRDREGIDLHREIRTRWPHLKLLLMSGHPREAYADVLGPVGECPFIKKPFRSEELVVAAGALLPAPHRRPS